MTVMGIGPLLAVVGVVTTTAIVVSEKVTGYTLSLPASWGELQLIVAIALVVIGVVFWLSSAVVVKRAFDSHRLVTTGPFRLSRNPMYAGFMLFLIPGIALILNDLLLILISVAMFVVFKARIRQEEEYLTREFGQSYEQYRRSVSQLIPFARL